MTIEIPACMDPYECTKFLETREGINLARSFYWADTPQGVDYWGKIASNTILLTESDIFLIESWIIEATFITS